MTSNVSAESCPGQDVAGQQGVVAFNSITEGQPGTPRAPRVSVLSSCDFGEDEFQAQFSFSGVVSKTGFWCQAQLAISAPTLDVGEGLIFKVFGN